MYQHTLIIGGTGMLRAASVQLATRSVAMTSVARTSRSLTAVDEMIPPKSATHHLLALDWAEPDKFIRGIRSHLLQTAPPDLVVAWVHDVELAIRLVCDLDAATPCGFFHVLGSAYSDPSAIAVSYQERVRKASIRYHQIILGYVVEGGARRWLTNEEISAGVIDAIARCESRHVVGTVRPWGAHP